MTMFSRIRFVYAVASVAIPFIFMSCVTSKDAKPRNPLKQASFESSLVEGDIVIVQPHLKVPVYSTKSLSHWISLKSSGNSELDKMRGHLAVGDWERSIQIGKAFLMKNPNHPESMMGLAVAYSIGRRYPMGAYFAQQVLRLQPTNSDAMNVMGLKVMLASGNRRADFQDAITWFQKSIDSDATQIAAALNLGQLQLEIGRSQDAMEPFRVAAKRCSSCNRAWIGLGMAASRSGQKEEAKEAFEEALSNDSGDAEARYHLAMNYRNNFNDSGKAAKILQEIVSDPDGRYKGDIEAKRQANTALRLIQARDRSGAPSKVGVQNVRPHSDQIESEVVPTFEAP